MTGLSIVVNVLCSLWRLAISGVSFLRIKGGKEFVFQFVSVFQCKITGFHININ